MIIIRRPGRPQNENKESYKWTNIWKLLENQKKQTVENESKCDTNCSWSTWNSLKDMEKKLEKLEIRDHSDRNSSVNFTNEITLTIYRSGFVI